MRNLIFSMIFFHSLVFGGEFCSDCSLELRHQHENGWIRALENNVLFRVQKSGKFNGSTLIINVYDYLKACKNVDPVKCHEFSITDDAFVEMIKCFKGESPKKYFPDVQFLDWGLYCPLDHKKCLWRVAISDLNRTEFESQHQILIVCEEYADSCPDRPKTFAEKISAMVDLESPYCRAGLGFAAGCAAWGILTLKDHFIGTIDDGLVFDPWSWSGVVIPIMITTATTAIVITGVTKLYKS